MQEERKGNSCDTSPTCLPNRWRLNMDTMVDGKLFCSCGSPQSFPIPHEHDLTEREKRILTAAKQEGIREVVEFVSKFLELAEYGDYSNGIVASGLDEGRVRANELLQTYRSEWQAFLKSKGIELRQ